MKKVLKYLGIFIGIILIIMILAPLLFKKQIVSTVKKEANKQVNAVINFDNDISLSFFRNFPNASLGISDLSVVGKDRYAGDTLAAIDQIHIVIDLSSLFGDTYKIRNVSLDNPYIQLLVDSAGHANWDIAKEDTSAKEEEAATSFKVGLQKYSIQNGHLIYADSSLHFFLDAEGLDHNGQGDFTQDVFDLRTKSHFKKLTVAYAGVPYLNKVNTDLIANININLPDSKYTLNKSTIKLNGLSLDVDGYLAMPNDSDIETNLTFGAKKADFKNFLSLIPAIYQKDFDKLKASGALAFDGYVKGVYNDHRIPAFGLKLKIDNGQFQYPSVPEPLSKVNLDLQIENKDGNLDHTFIDVKQLHFLLGQNPFNAHLTATNIKSNPSVDGAVDGKVNLDDVSKIYPLEEGTDLSGLLNIDVKVKGNVNDIQNEKYDQFNADGEIIAQNLVYKSKDLDQKVELPQGTLTFSPQQVAVKDLKAIIGKSDIAANGGVDNLFGYLFGKDVLKGHLTIKSQLLDLNDMMGEDTATAVSETEETDSTGGVKAVTIPKDIAFNLNTNIGRFIYDNYELNNVQGKVKVANGVLTIQNISTNMLDGSAQLAGTYDTRNPEEPKTDMTFNVKNVDIQKTFKTFNTVKLLAPVASFVDGDFSGDISLNTTLNDHLYPLFSTLNSLGSLEVPNFNIKGFGPLKELASKLGIPKLKDLDISKLFMKFKVDSGYLVVKPFEFNVDNIDMKVAGKNGLNKDIDYTIQMDVPRDKLGDANNALTSLITKANAATKGDLDLGDKLPVAVHLGGTITHPKVKLDFSEAKELVAQKLKAEAKSQLTNKAGSLIDNLLKSKQNKRTDSTQSSKVDSTEEKNTKEQTKEDIKDKVKKGLNGLFGN